MSDEKKIIIDDDWKQEAQREKERLAAETAAAADADGPMPAPSFLELLNLLVMQSLVGLGAISGPGGERIPPNLEVAKHYIDMLQMLEEKTKGNLNAEEQKVLDQTLYEIRMRYIQMTSGGGGISGAPGGAPPGPAS